MREGCYEVGGQGTREPERAGYQGTRTDASEDGSNDLEWLLVRLWTSLSPKPTRKGSFTWFSDVYCEVNLGGNRISRILQTSPAHPRPGWDYAMPEPEPHTCDT